MGLESSVASKLPRSGEFGGALHELIKKYQLRFIDMGNCRFLYDVSHLCPTLQRQVQHLMSDLFSSADSKGVSGNLDFILYSNTTETPGVNVRWPLTLNTTFNDVWGEETPNINSQTYGGVTSLEAPQTTSAPLY